MTRPETPGPATGNKSPSNDTWVLEKYALDKHAIVAITDAEGRINYVNDLFCEISGYTREELIGRTHHIVNSGFHDSDFFHDMFAIIHEEGIWRGEICNRRKNGELYWVETTISQLKDDNGNVEGYIALRTDVTDQHRTLEAMRRLHEITSDRAASIATKADRILQLGCEIFNLPLAIISQIDHDVYTVRYTRAPEGALSVGDTFQLGNTYCSDTIARNRPVAHHHVAESTTCNHPAYRDFGLEAYIGAPLRVHDHIYGTINFSGPEPRERAFGSGEIELIQLFAKWIGDELARSATDAELERQRMLLDAVSEQARIGAWELDLTTEELYWSEVTRIIHEVDDDFVPTLDNAIDFYGNEKARAQIQAYVNEAITTGTPWQAELPLITGKGRQIWVAARGAPVMQNGVCTKLFGSFQDITQKREEAAKSYEQAQRHQLMVESTAVGFWDWNIKTGETVFSERWAEIIGYTLEELEPVNIETWLKHCHPDDLVVSGAKLEEYWQGKTTLYACEARMRHKNGRWVWVYDTGRVVEWDEDGSPLRMIGTHLDINEHKKVQAEVHLSHQRMRLATESGGISVWEYDISNGEISWDQGMMSLYGISEQSLPMTIDIWEKALHTEDRAWVMSKLNDSIRFGRPFDFEFRILRPDESLRYVRTAATVMLDEHGLPSRMVGMSSDITHQKVSEQALLRAKKEAEAAARAKSDFLATMSHEIRTPMNGVLGMLNLLRNTRLTDDQLNRVRIAQNSAQSLLALINDILDFSKIEANKLELEKIDFDLNRIITECIESLSNLAEDKGVEIILDTTQLHSPVVNGDPGRVRQVLTNLLSNAVKFTSEGEVTISVEQTLMDNQWKLNFAVEDTGVGIPESKISNLFNAFNQLDTSTTREFGGSGLGLAIVKNLCERMGGGVKVESKVDVGSCFTATLKVAVSADNSQARLSLKGMNILLIEDHDRARELYSGHLRDLGALVTDAANAHDASEKIINAGQTYDLMLLDNNILGENWRDSASALSQLPALDTALRLLMVPVSFRQSDRFADSESLHGHILKPLNVISLVEYIESRQTMTEATTSIAHNNTFPDFRSKRVLLVEDNRVNQLVAEEMLTALGIKVTVADNGQAALEILQNANNSFDLILMDCQMPVMDGYQATRSLRHGRAGEQNQSIPVIAMTAHAMTGDKERCLAAGMNDYLAKPVDPALLHKLLERWLEVDDNVPAIPPPNQRELTTQAPTTGGHKVWDRTQALNRVMGNETLLSQLIDMFQSEQPLRLREMSAMLKDENFNALREAAHNLKGVAGNLGLVGIQTASAQMDQDIRQGKHHLCKQRLEEINQETSKFMALVHADADHTDIGDQQELRDRLINIRHSLTQNDYISQKSLEFMLKSYGNPVIEEELAKLAREITAFENAKAQTRLNLLLKQLSQSTAND